MYVLETLAGGRRRGPSGHTYRKATSADFASLIATMGGFSNVRKVVVPPEESATADVP